MDNIKFRWWKPLSNSYKFCVDAGECIPKRCVHGPCMTRGDGTIELKSGEQNVFEFYSGVKDSTGQEIYENDIVKNSFGEGVCKFFAGMFLLEYPDQSDSGPLGFLPTHELKITGNIHNQD